MRPSLTATICLALALAGVSLDARAQVPGARSPFLPDGLPARPADPVGGAPTGLFVPAGWWGLLGGAFRETTVLSFNFQTILVTFGAGPGRDQFDPAQPYAAYDPEDPATARFRGRCSLAQPQYCASVRAFFEIASAAPARLQRGPVVGVRRLGELRAGGNARLAGRSVLGPLAPRPARVVGPARPAPVPSGRPSSPCPLADPERCALWRMPAFVPAVLAGDTAGAGLLGDVVGIPSEALPLVPLNEDPLDAALADDSALSARLTDAQEALLGCGAWWGTVCDRQGIDLRNAEASALLQSWIGLSGAAPPVRFDAATGRPVPPTFANEMAALSYNLQTLLAALSRGGDPAAPDQLDPANPYAAYDPGDPATAPFAGKCSFLQPQYCASVLAFLDVVRPQPVRAGGNGSFGRRDFVWAADVPANCLPAPRGLGRLSGLRMGTSAAHATRRAGRCPPR